MKCNCCGYDEDKGKLKFVGIFSPQKTFLTTNDELCGLYGCPNCNSVQFTTDSTYIDKRKNEYKEKIKNK